MRSRLPDVYISITDGGLGIQAATSAGIFAKIGVSNKGELKQIAALSDPDQIKDIFGTGPLANSLADSFAQGTRMIYAMRVEGDLEGSIGAVEKSRSEASLTVTGKPLDAYEVILKINTSGGLNEAIFSYSLDGGDNYSGLLTIPLEGEYEIPDTGIKIVFTGNYEAEDQFSFSTAAPNASVGKVMEAIAFLLDTTLKFENIHVVGESSKSMWVAADVLMKEAEVRFRYLYASFESRYQGENETTDAWVQSLVEERRGFSSTRVQVIASFGEVYDRLTGRQVRRSLGGHHRGQVATLKIQQSPGEVAVGPLKGIVQMMPADLNEAHILTLDLAGYATVRSFIGMNGIYITNGRILADETSDYQQEENRRVMDEACFQTRMQALRFVKGGATERSLKALQAYMQHALDTMQGEEKIYAGRIIIPPDQDIWSTEKLKAKVRITPVPIMREIETDMGFENPFLVAKLEG